VAVFIDHARDLATVERAIRLGATSVMVDGSHLSLGDNVRLTSRAAALAHGARISIEGEIGILGEEDGSGPEEKHYTNAGDAELFVRETRVDALAVAIGNAHGFYKRPPRLDFARLAEIRSRVDVPLVLHGGSGIPPGDIRRAVDMGIAKVNIGAEARSAFMQGLRRSLADAGEHEKFPHRVFPAALECHARVVEEKMELLLSCGKA
jgi:ketose-bisphosphate aldolase